MDGIETVITDLRRALDVSYKRTRVISENIANAETPGYKARKVDFQKALADSAGSLPLQVVKSNPGHLTPPGGDDGITVEASDHPARADGNNVNREQEIVNLSENTIIYNTTIEILSRKFRLLRTAIEEGR